MALEGFIAGATAGAVARTIITPIAVLRIRLQVDHDIKRPTIREAAAMLWRQEGWRGLWRGGMAGQLLYASYSGVQFMVYHELEALKPYASPLASDFVSGGIAGITATVATFPFDVLRTHMVLSRCPPFSIPDATLTSAARGIMMREGVPGFFRGLFPSLITILPLSSLTFSIYGFLKRTYKPSGDLATWESGVLGSLSGIVAQTTVFPLDLAKKRLQAQYLPKLAGDQSYPTYKGMTDCIIKTFKSEGPLGLFRGGTTTIMKQAVAAGVIFSVNDFLRKAFGLTKQDKKA